MMQTTQHNTNHQGTDIRKVSDGMLEGSLGPSRLSHPSFPLFEKTHMGPPDPLDLNKTSQKNKKLSNFRFLVPRGYLASPPSVLLSHHGSPFVYRPREPCDLSIMRSEILPMSVPSNHAKNTTECTSSYVIFLCHDTKRHKRRKRRKSTQTTQNDTFLVGGRVDFNRPL